MSNNDNSNNFLFLLAVAVVGGVIVYIITTGRIPTLFQSMLVNNQTPSFSTKAVENSMMRHKTNNESTRKAERPITSVDASPADIPHSYQIESNSQAVISRPSFDCRNATYHSEKLVCQSKQLCLLDLQMANSFREVWSRTKAVDRKALKDAQNFWLRRVREACANESCLNDVYLARIKELDDQYR